MAVLTSFNETVYKRLLSRTVPKVVKSEAENERIIAELERLDTLGRELTPEEKELSELLTVLVRQFEENRYPLGHASPAEALRELMEQHELRQRDLIPIFGSSSVASDVVNGKRSISKVQARKLSERFHVPIDLFIS
jgi:HTH-type transcriptional regulator/antitoxin HigA